MTINDEMSLANSLIDSDKVAFFGSDEKRKVNVVNQGVKSAMTAVAWYKIDTDNTTTAGTSYIRCSDGRIRKVVTTSDATGSFYGGYIAAANTAWIDRVTATYTKE